MVTHTNRSVNARVVQIGMLMLELLQLGMFMAKVRE